MKWILLLLLASLQPVQASEFRHWNQWSQEEKIEYLLFTTINYTDFAQTELCVGQKAWAGCYEQNPLFGSTPNDASLAAGFVSSQILYYYLMGKSDNNNFHQKFRMIFLGTKIAIVWANDYNGVRVNKVW